jgi:hypothetical protein
LNPVEEFRHSVLDRLVLFEHNLVEASVGDPPPAFVLVTFMLLNER